MKQIIEGKTYDTETAVFIENASEMDYRVLYKTGDGDYFYYCKSDDGEETIEPCSNDEGWIVEILADDTAPISYEEWKKEQKGLMVVKEFILNNIDHPFEGELVVKKDRDKLEIYGSKGLMKISLNLFMSSFSIDDNYDLDDYQKAYEIFKNGARICELFLTEIGYDFCDDDYDE